MGPRCNKHLIGGLTTCTQELRSDNAYPNGITTEDTAEAKDLGQLVVLGFDVAVFTPAPYQRHRL